MKCVAKVSHDTIVFVPFKGRPPVWRDFHSATTVGNKMFVFGGRSDQFGQFHSNKEIYDDQLRYLDLTDNHWYQPEIRGTDRPCGRRSHSACELKAKPLIPVL